VGHAAIAWEIGVITGLADADTDVRDADLFVGTSAGSVVASQITSGLMIEELFQQQVDPHLQVDEAAPPIDFKEWRAELARAKEGGGPGYQILRRVGSLAIDALTVSASERRKTIAQRLPLRTWPKQRMLVVAVDAVTGELRAFDRTSNVDLIDAVAASSKPHGLLFFEIE
jgi:NTE family protein